MNKALIVLSECVDVRNGNRFARGDEFNPAPNFEQAKRLVAAGCLPEDALKATAGPKSDAEAALEEKAKRDAADEAQRQARADAAKAKRTGRRDAAWTAVDQINNDGLFDLGDDDLRKIAADEKIDLGDATEPAQIIAAIRAARTKG